MGNPYLGHGVLLATSCAASTIPGNLPNGVYQVDYHPDGYQVHRGLTLNYTTTLRRKAHNPMPKRNQTGWGGWEPGMPEFWCGCGLTMYGPDCDKAVDMLREYVMSSRNNYSDSRTAWYSVWGGVVAFSCNWGYDTHNAEHFTQEVNSTQDYYGWYAPSTYASSLEGLSDAYVNNSESLELYDAADGGGYEQY